MPDMVLSNGDIRQSNIRGKKIARIELVFSFNTYL